MKALAFLALVGFSALACASDMAPREEEQEYPQAEQYNYAEELDISRIIRHGEVSHECGVVPSQMVYEDRQGQQRTVEYLINGHGCNGG